ncbi:beta-ketoacyl synthase [Bacillus cytotoxicus]
MKRRVVITGIGLVNPAGIGKEQFWDTIVKNKVSIKEISRFDTTGFPVKVAGEVEGFKIDDYVPRRLKAKTDRFIHYALGASKLAIEDSNLNLDEIDPYQVGVFFGNNSGGWDICEKGFYEYYKHGPLMVNPWQATAWFPTAPQGYVTIANGIKGYSKSFISDRASGASAIYFAARSIEMGHNNVILAGGTEAPITALGITCYSGTGDLSQVEDPDRAYRPFSNNSSGLVLGEGSTVLILEEMEHAIKRGAHIYGEILGSTASKNNNLKDSYVYAKNLRNTLEKSGFNASSIDLIFPEGSGVKGCDELELAALQAVFNTENPSLPVSVPKSNYGHLYGASFATEIACGLLGMETKKTPPFRQLQEVSNERSYELTKEYSMNINNFLVNSIANDGTNISLLVSKAR